MNYLTQEVSESIAAQREQNIRSVIESAIETCSSIITAYTVIHGHGTTNCCYRSKLFSKKILPAFFELKAALRDDSVSDMLPDLGILVDEFFDDVERIVAELDKSYPTC